MSIINVIIIAADATIIVIIIDIIGSCNVGDNGIIVFYMRSDVCVCKYMK